MRIAVTGAAGHLGAHLCRRLVEIEEEDLVRIDLLDLPDGEGASRKADLSDPRDARTALAGAETVIHCASIHPWKSYTDQQYLDLNIKSTWNVYAAAKELNIERVILTGSIAAVGYSFPPELWPVSEELENTPCDLYSFTKHSQEGIGRHFAEYGEISTIALRPPAFMPKGELETGVSLLGPFALVEDIAEAHVAALKTKDLPARFEPFFITNRLPYRSENPSLAGDPWALAEQYYPGVRAWFSRRGSFNPVISAAYSIEKAERLLGWKPQYNFDWWWTENRDRL